MRDKHQIIEEPCEGKLSRTVLKTSGVGDSLAEFNSIGWAYVDLEGNLQARGPSSHFKVVYRLVSRTLKLSILAYNWQF